MYEPLEIAYSGRRYAYDGNDWMEVATCQVPATAIIPDLIAHAERDEHIEATVRLRHVAILEAKRTFCGQRSLGRTGLRWRKCRYCHREADPRIHLSCSQCEWMICRCGTCECRFQDNESKFLRRSATQELIFRGYCRTEGVCGRCGTLPASTRRLYRVLDPTDGSVLEYGPECFKSHLVYLLKYYADREADDSSIGKMLRLNLENLKGSFIVFGD